LLDPAPFAGRPQQFREFALGQAAELAALPAAIEHGDLEVARRHLPLVDLAQGVDAGAQRLGKRRPPGLKVRRIASVRASDWPPIATKLASSVTDPS